MIIERKARLAKKKANHREQWTDSPKSHMGALIIKRIKRDVKGSTIIKIHPLKIIKSNGHGAGLTWLLIKRKRSL